MTLSGSRVLIFQQRGWGHSIGHHIAKSLQADGAVLAALTLKPSTDQFIRSQTEVKYELIESHDMVMGDPAGALGDTRYSLQHVCDELGVSSLWQFAQSLRNHVRSYGDSYYYGYRQNVSDEDISLYFQAAYHMCRRLLDEFKPDVVVVPNFVALPHIFMRLLTKQRNIPMFGITDTKVSGVLVFTHSFLDDEGPFIDRLDQLDAGLASPNLDRARSYVEQNRQSLMSTSSMDLHVASRSLYRDMRSTAARIRHTRKGSNAVPVFGRTLDAPGMRIAIRDFFRNRQYASHAEKRRYSDFEKVGRFALFPLQVQPEESLDVIAPHFNNQIETARRVAMSLPGDMTLVVKDHPVMAGLRKPSYLEKLERTPNVKLIHHRVRTDTLLRATELVIASTGTVFAEAAILGVPAVQLGNLGTIKRLPNVVHHSDISTLGEAIERALSIDSNSDDYSSALQRFVAAAYDTGFEHDYFGVWEQRNQDVRDAVVGCFTDEVKRCLEMSASAVEPA